jgi:uncharacterized protein DUF4013
MTNTPSPFDSPRSALDGPSVFGTRPGGRTSMQYMEAYNNFFRSPKWGMNLLFLSICALIPIIGPIVMQGWAISVIARQHTQGDDYPLEFKFERFTEFLSKGIWTFLTGLILGLVFLFFSGAAATPLFLVRSHHGSMAALGIASGLVFLLAMLTFVLVNHPLGLRAAFHQSLSGVFAFDFIRDFVGKMWVETIVALLFLGTSSIVLVILGYLMCGFGLYPAIALLTHASYQLSLQLYEVYLSKGGLPIEMSSALAATQP